MSVVDQDREEARDLRHHPATPLPTWYAYGHRQILRVAVQWEADDQHAALTRAHAVGMLRGAIESGVMPDAQIGELARGIVAGLRDAGLAPEAVNT